MSFNNSNALVFDFKFSKCSQSYDPKPYKKRLKDEVEKGLLPFLTLPFCENLINEIEELRPFFSKYKHLLLLGIGGSALGPRALQKAFAPSQDRPLHEGKSLWIIDNVDATSFEDILQRLPKEETFVVTISKSGGTIETLAQYFIVRELYKKLFPENWQDHFLHITDKNKGFLREEANLYSIKTLEVPDNLGGRYSVFSAVGMLPAAFLDIDYKSLLKGATDIGRALASNYDLLDNHDAYKLASFAFEAIEKNYSQVIFFVYHPLWATYGAWFMQLWAESLGKDGKGSMPIAAVGATDQHSVLQMFLDGPKDKICFFVSGEVDKISSPLPKKIESKNNEWCFLENKSIGDILEAETLATKMALVDNAVPLAHIHATKTDCYATGQLFLNLELATILTGWLLEINPVNQPAVEQGKVLAYAKLGSKNHSQYLQKLKEFEEK